jgi:hypothetical protein
MAKCKSKSKPKSKQKPWITITGRFPSESEFAAQTEAKSHYPSVEDEPIFDPAFPTKKAPNKQALIDIYQTVRKLNNFEEFAQALEDVLPFWIKHSTISAILQQQVALAIQQRGAELRAKYDGDPVPPAIPNTILGQRDWLTDYKRCSQQLPKPDSEPLVRIENAIGELVISHSRVKQAARDKEIYSEQPGGKPNSPYIVHKSEVQKKFGPHGPK